MIDVDGDLLLSAWSWYLQRESATAARMLGKPTSKQGRNCEAVGLEAVWNTRERDDTTPESEKMEEREGVPPCSYSIIWIKTVTDEIIIIRGCNFSSLMATRK